MKTECRNCGKAVPSTAACEVGPLNRLEYICFKCGAWSGVLFDGPVVFEAEVNLKKGVEA